MIEITEDQLEKMLDWINDMSCEYHYMELNKEKSILEGSGCYGVGSIELKVNIK